MGALAEAYVAVRPDTRNFGKELKTGLRKVDAEKAGKESGRKFGGAFGGTVKGILGGTAILGALAGAIGFLKDANAEARESIKVGKTTEQIIKSTGGAAKISASQVGALATAISNKTGMDDEAIQSGANLLLTFKNVRNEVGKGSNVFDRATASAVDLSAAGFGSVSSSSKMLGKALNDPIKGISALSRAGVTFSDKQKTTIKRMVETGDVLGAQKIILQEVESQVGDVAEAQATWADKAKVAFENVKETVGGFLTGALEPVSKWFVKVGLPAVQDFFTKISQDKALKTAVADLKAALAGFSDKDFKAALTDIAAALPPIVSGLGQVVTKYTEISDAIDKFENASFGEGDKVGGPVGQIVKDFGAGGTIEKAIIQFRGFVGRHVRQGWADARASFVENHGAIIDDVQRFIGGVIGWFARLPGRVMTWVRKTWADARASFVENHRGILSDVRRFIGGVVGWFANLAGRVTAWVRRMWAEAKASFVKNHSELLAGVRRFLAGMIGSFTGWFANLKTKWSTFWAGIKTTGSAAINSVRTTIGTVLGRIRDGFASGVTAIGRAWDKIKATARTPVAFVVNTVLNDGLLEAFRAISKLVNYGPGKDFKVSMAKGGVLPGYTPGRDVHRFYSPTGGAIDLSGGEGIARPEIVRAIGKKRWDAANREAVHGRISKAVGYLGGYFLGGQAPVPGGVSGKHSRAAYPWATWAGDLSAGMGTPVRAWNSGRVAAVHNWGHSYGHHVRVNHPGNQQTLYAHMRDIIVRVGQAIGRGGLLGHSDSTGNSTGPHLHFELKGGQGSLGGTGQGPGGIGLFVDAAKYISQVTDAIGRLKEIGGTPFGQMVAGIPKMVAGAVKDKITSLAGTMGSTSLGSIPNAGSGSNRAIGRAMMIAAGWNAGQWPALERLWTGESNWNHRARNSSSGAYGIPQALPASKMRAAGADYLTNPRTQIRWGLGYIRQRYGSPQGALNFWNSKSPHWYDDGGWLPPGLSLAMNGTGRSERVVPPGGGSRPVNIYVDLGDGVTQRVQGVLDEHDEFRASVGRMR